VTRVMRQSLLMSIAALSFLLLLLFLANFDLTRDPRRPEDLDGLAIWLAHHPADWLAASAITDRSLDSALPLQRRVAMWRSSYILAAYLAPLRMNPTAGFVRAGLFHWYELGTADRKAVLEAAAPMLRDPTIFAALHRPLWELTRDLGYLRRSAPRTINALWMLRELALASGDFAEYRELRGALRDARMNEFRARQATATVAELIDILPQPITADDEPLIRAILEEIDRRPFEPHSMGARVEDVALYAIRHDVKPLTALAPLVDRVAFEVRNGQPALAALYRTRAIVANAPAANVWTNACGVAELCTSVFRIHDGPLQFKLSVAQSDEIAPYVEVYLDDVLVAEGEVRDEKTFSLDAGPGPHRTEVRLVNRTMRNGTQRRVRLS